MKTDKPKPELRTEQKPEPDQKRLNVPVTESGAIDLASMRETTKDKLRAALTPDTLAALRVVAPPGAVSGHAADVISPLLVDALYDTLGRITRLGVVRMTGATEDQSEPMLYSAKDKDDLRDPTTRLLAKYSSAWLTKYGDELALLAAIGSLTLSKVEAVRSRVQADQARLNRSYEQSQEGKA